MRIYDRITKLQQEAWNQGYVDTHVHLSVDPPNHMQIIHKPVDVVDVMVQSDSCPGCGARRWRREKFGIRRCEYCGQEAVRRQ